MTADPKHAGFYTPGLETVADPRPKACNASAINDGILLPGFDCVNESCRGFTGTAREDHKVCRFCGTPRPVNLEKTMLENLTSVQARCTELLLENRELCSSRQVALALLKQWYEDCDTRGYDYAMETKAFLERLKVSFE